MKSSKFKRLFFSGVEIVLLLAFLFSAGSGAVNYTQKRRIDKLTTENVNQSVKIDGLVLKIDDINKKKDGIIEEKQIVEDKLKKQAAMGFSILYEQAVDVNNEYSSPFTNTHLETAKEYIKLWGYESIARIIKWQSEQIQEQMKETRRLMEKENSLRTEYLQYKAETQKVIYETKEETEKHKLTAQSLKSKVDEFMGANNWLQSLIRMIVIGGVIYVFLSFGGIGMLMRTSNRNKRQKNKLVKAVKTFTAVDDIGNETMCRVMKGSGIDLDKEDDDI